MKALALTLLSACSSGERPKEVQQPSTRESHCRQLYFKFPFQVYQCDADGMRCLVAVTDSGISTSCLPSEVSKK